MIFFALSAIAFLDMLEKSISDSFFWRDVRATVRRRLLNRLEDFAEKISEPVFEKLVDNDVEKDFGIEEIKLKINLRNKTIEVIQRPKYEIILEAIRKSL
jgi:hypothetical protein